MPNLPAKHTNLRIVANHLLNTRDIFGRADTTPLRDLGMSLSTINNALIRLRKHYKFYTRRQMGSPWLVYVPAHWPTDTLVDRTFYSPYIPRRTKFRGPPANSAELRNLYDYILSHRNSGGFISLDAMHKKYGSVWVHRKLKVLRKHYGFEIDKPIKGVQDSLFIVKKVPNVLLPVEKLPTVSGKELAELAFFGDVKCKS